MKFFVVLFCLCGVAFGQGPAGMVLYAKKGGEVLLLVASHRASTRGFAAFGGKAEEGENSLETAARETEEETRGYFKRVWLKEKVGKGEPVVEFGYSMYFVEVPWVDVKEIEKMKLPGGKGGFMEERVFYVWVPAKDVFRVLDGGAGVLLKGKVGEGLLPEGAKQDYYWRIWLAQMFDAKSKGKLEVLK